MYALYKNNNEINIILYICNKYYIILSIYWTKMEKYNV